MEFIPSHSPSEHTPDPATLRARPLVEQEERLDAAAAAALAQSARQLEPMRILPQLAHAHSHTTDPRISGLQDQRARRRPVRAVVLRLEPSAEPAEPAAVVLLRRRGGGARRQGPLEVCRGRRRAVRPRGRRQRERVRERAREWLAVLLPVAVAWPARVALSGSRQLTTPGMPASCGPP